MAKLAVWSIEDRSGDNGADLTEPKKVEPSSVELEKWLEDWIVKDVSLIGEGLTLVGRQMTIDNGRLDLLAIDLQERWVVIEVKAERLFSGALHQALGYAASLARLDAQELREKLHENLKINPASFRDAQAISQKFEALLGDEDEQREITVMLVGVGIDPGLERMKEFLEREGLRIPINIVSFEVFKLDAGPKLLVREVIEEPSETPLPKRKYTLDAVRQRAKDAGVVAPFDHFVRMSKQAGLAVQPIRNVSIRIAPPQNRIRFLMYACPYTNAKGPAMHIEVNGLAFLEFFPGIDKGEATAVNGKGKLTGKELDKRLDQIERFLTRHSKHFLTPSADDA